VHLLPNATFAHPLAVWPASGGVQQLTHADRQTDFEAYCRKAKASVQEADAVLPMKNQIRKMQQLHARRADASIDKMYDDKASFTVAADAEEAPAAAPGWRAAPTDGSGLPSIEVLAAVAAALALCVLLRRRFRLSLVRI
jgi:hypothetical protein